MRIKIYRSLFVIVAALALYPCTAHGASKHLCFIALGLKSTLTIDFTMDGPSATGTVHTKSDDLEEAKPISFTADVKLLGSKTKLYVMFGNLPYQIPIVWTLTQKSKKTILQVPYYGQNYDTKKYSVYDVIFQPCSSGGARSTTS